MTDKQIITKSQMIMRIAELSANLEAKEQECEELKNIIDEAKNSKLDLKSFLVGEAIQNEYEQQLDQLKLQLAEIKELIQSEYCIVIGSCEICDEVGDCINGKILQKISEVIPDEKS